MATDFLSAVILGIAEGATEFLPISSTGHLILLNQWFAFEESFTKLFDIVIQSGAILAVIILFWKDLWPSEWSVKEFESKWGRIFVAFAVTAVIGFLLGGFAEERLFTPLVVASALIVYGLIFLWLENRPGIAHRKELTYQHAALIGLMQSLALVPGTSRSGATIIGMMLLGYARPQAARFSFLLAVPTLLAASAYSLLKYDAPIHPQQIFYLLIGFFVSFMVAYTVSKWFLEFIGKNTFKPFAWYRIALGAVVLWMLWL